MDTNNDPIALLSEAVDALRLNEDSLRAENSELRESIQQVQYMMSAEDRGWTLVAGVLNEERLEGLDLSELKNVVKFIQPKVAAASLPGRACDLHSGFVWGRGINIDGIEATGRVGNPTNLVKFARRRVNRESFLSASAQQELQKARFVEGNVLFACDPVAGSVRRIPMLQITDVRVDKDFPEDVIAYQRTWNPDGAGRGAPVVRWYVTNRWEGKRPGSFDDGVGGSVAVDQSVTIIDGRFNRQTGWALGLPDALAGVHWAEAYGEHLQYGQVVTEALSKLLFKIKNNSKAQTQSSAAKIAGMTGVGNTASMGDGQDVEAIRTAGNAYSFEKLRPIAAMAAAAWNVSNADLLNDSAAAGASYGALNGLVLGNRNAMTLMQREWVDLFQEIFEFMGLGRPKIWFEPIEAPDMYRHAQALTLLAPNLTEEELRSKALDIVDISGDPRDVDNILRSKFVADATAAQAASPDQGQANGTGGASSAQKSDLRSDGISESLTAMAGFQIDEFRDLVERFERAKNS